MAFEKVLLAGIRLPYEEAADSNVSLDELEELASTAGYVSAGKFLQNRRELDPKTGIGHGKVSEIQEEFNLGKEIRKVIFNRELSPGQVRNLETAWGIRVLTRTELILQIFSKHARSRTSKIQVELAQLEYEMPRIIGKGIEMSRLGGGVGTRGPGEKQLEIDRRKIQKRIDVLHRTLKEISGERLEQRKRRSLKNNKVAIVGYTNAGKSTLLKRLTKAEVLVEDKLFATLDTTTRKLWIGDVADTLDSLILTDTVGFIRDIPHGLIESFKSTLEDTLIADLLIHVADASSPNFPDKMRVVEETLREIGAGEIPILVCLNKADRLSDEERLELRLRYPDAVQISALKNLGILDLKRIIAEKLMPADTLRNLETSDYNK